MMQIYDGMTLALYGAIGVGTLIVAGIGYAIWRVLR